MPAPRSLLAGWLVAVSACAYVGPAQIEDKIDNLDHDGDGAPFGGPAESRDCDDFNDKVAPGLDEVPYDGLDNDCIDGDVVDADGDGFPGIARADYPGKDWPGGVSEDLVDCRDDLLAEPKARSIYPGAPDAPYDGLDSNCAGDTDFDVDGDGYLPDAFLLNGQVYDTRAAYDAYLDAWGYDLGDPQWGDCDDFEERVHPGVAASEDLWYDGVDSNCDGTNDFDQDGDGWMPDEAANAVEYENFVDKFHGGDPWWGAPQWGDCQDAEDAALSADPAAVYPGATDTWYDGVDSDCAANNDFDQDGDGVMPNAVTGVGQVKPLFEAYAAAWGYTFDIAFGDCEDTEPTVSPGALELFGDALDGDCDGEPDFTPFGFGGYSWEDPRPPVLVATNSHYLLVELAEELDVGAGLSIVQPGVVVPFERPDPGAGVAGAGYDADPGPLVQYHIAAHPVGFAPAAIAAGDTFWATVMYNSGGQTGYLAKEYTYQPLQSLYVGGPTDISSSFYDYYATDVSMALDELGEGWFVGCGERNVTAMKMTGVPQSSPSAIRGDLPPNCDDVDSSCLVYGPPADLCFFDGPPDGAADLARVHLCEAGVDCQTYVFDADDETLTPTVDQPFAGRALAAGEWKEDWFLLTDAGGGAEMVSRDLATSYRIFADEPLLSFDASWRGAELYAVAVIDGPAPRLELRWGDPTVDADLDGLADLQAVTVPFADPARPSLVLERAAVYADDERLVIAVSADHPTLPVGDAVGWIFLGWP